MKWRTDTENAPKDRPILVINPYWHGRKPWRGTYVVVEYTQFIIDGSPSNKYGWAYDYDHDDGSYLTIKNFTHWCELSLPDEEYDGVFC